MNTSAFSNADSNRLNIHTRRDVKTFVPLAMPVAHKFYKSQTTKLFFSDA